MIFVINETNEQLTLKTTSLENGATVDLQIGDSAEGTIAVTESKEIALAIAERFGAGEAIRNKVSKHNFKLETSRMYLDNKEKDGSVKLVAIKNNDELPERYRYAKDVIVVVHKSSDIVSMKEDSLNGDVRTVETEQGEYKITIFVIKWYNWSKLSSPVSVNINDRPAYALQATANKNIEGRLFNSVVRINNDKKKNNNKRHK